ncbi:FAD/NAD(P)-binding protein [Aliiglaciecola sp. LCG003]|uniref:FAD/NAD(P)-binding protein n=1 Tax=Aliiglaciecola sp. LCG003 TaxID=3053655 RepID=UPI002574804C|nr:FAD/NAD(P)-binding protein [Aliiglaciecola sp. LCG003]WJG07692.1 FAD/NAD(P)-binding protein [Aliiglaciecola sp. LCG003]
MLQLTPQAIQVVDIYEDGTDARHFTFEPINFKHKNLVQIGQFFMLSVPGYGLAPFTYTSLPDESGRFCALVRKVGKLTAALFSIKQGDTLGYTGPCGTGWPVEKLAQGDVLIVAGGCGLAPLASTIDYLIKQGRGAQVTLIYGSHDLSSQVLSRERAVWNKNIILFETLSIEGDKDHTGRTTQHIKHVLRENQRHPSTVLTCGPEAMMKSTAKICMDIGIPSENIWLSIERRMRCGVGLCGHCYLADSYACKQGPTYRFDTLLTLENKSIKTEPHSGGFQFC